MDERRVVGNIGETHAVRYLENLGYRILARQWKKLPWGEIDIIALEKDELVFVEVKSRRTAEYGFPEAAVTRSKREKIAKLIDWYLQSNRINNRPYRFDVIAIEFQGIHPKINHIRSVEV